MKFFLFIALFSLLLHLYGCQNATDNQTTVSTPTPPAPMPVAHQVNGIAKPDSVIPPLKEKNTSTPTNPSTTIPAASSHFYQWLDEYPKELALSRQISTPSGYQRISLDQNSFGTWLRGLPLLPKSSKVMLYNGNTKAYQAGAHRVLNIDIGKRDLQQCADAVMRLKAEYHYSQQDYEAIHFNYTSGHTIRFSDWSKGKKPKIKGNKVSFSSPSGSVNSSYANFKKYLTNVYSYAGTASLSKELRSKPVKDIMPGDVFIWGGFPGHAILVMDVAKHPKTGKKIFLVAQSYMPAQSIHILKNLNDQSLSPWYSEDFGEQLNTPEWTFDRNSLKQF
ncbi:DUF4846 domain-containing protein [Aureispira anguillae]|uniref:DUF4846 domain-containing protein n=1 Tax=Aureispira anguillae TaxID=2864201 RepID=A0A915YEP7_9BACT|nr:DUF4846 domain-containing protein [Aureispira anguillae]BDS11743.1 DUF4846 domain-containing protein [Aureispira anguillae]